ncbi:MAG: hypothetical protein QM784_34145 [Polyangiaceae bacterium]
MLPIFPRQHANCLMFDCSSDWIQASNPSLEGNDRRQNEAPLQSGQKHSKPQEERWEGPSASERRAEDSRFTSPHSPKGSTPGASQSRALMANETSYRHTESAPNRPFVPSLMGPQGPIFALIQPESTLCDSELE